MSTVATSNRHVASYLSDHLAGAAGAISMMQHIETVYAGADVAAVVAAVRKEVEEDRDQLERLAAMLGVEVSTPRKVVGWAGEKMAEVKLGLDDSHRGALHLLEALDGLAMGIDGKLALWQGLDAAATDTPVLRSLDYDRLSKRAQDQRQRIEPSRLAAARALFQADKVS